MFLRKEEWLGKRLGWSLYAGLTPLPFISCVRAELQGGACGTRMLPPSRPSRPLLPPSSLPDPSEVFKTPPQAMEMDRTFAQRSALEKILEPGMRGHTGLCFPTSLKNT